MGKDIISSLTSGIGSAPTGALIFKGTINVPADFPTLAAVQNGWTYIVETNVTDNDPTKTNTGQSFLAGDEIAWNGSNWSTLGGFPIWIDDGSNVSTANSPRNVRANTFQSLVLTGTSPLTVASSTLVINLNADLLDGQHGAFYATDSLVVHKAGTETITGVKTFNTYFSMNANMAAPSHSEGNVYWDKDNHTLALQTFISDVTLQVGQEFWVFVRNNSGAPILNGSVVYFSGAIAQKPTIALSKADVSSTAIASGVATSDISNNSDGFITTEGLVRDINTSAFSEGDTLYLSATTAGAFTNIAPSTPNFVIKIGKVLIDNPATGVILVDSDVAPNSITSLDILRIHNLLQTDKIDITTPSSVLEIVPSTKFTSLSVLNGIVQTNAIGLLSSSTSLPNGTTATTQTALDNSTKLATTAYVDSAITGENLWDRTGVILTPHTLGDNVNLKAGQLFWIDPSNTTGTKSLTISQTITGLVPGFEHATSVFKGLHTGIEKIFMQYLGSSDDFNVFSQNWIYENTTGTVSLDEHKVNINTEGGTGFYFNEVWGRNSVGAQTIYYRDRAIIRENGEGNESGSHIFDVVVDGLLAQYIDLNGLDEKIYLGANVDAGVYDVKATNFQGSYAFLLIDPLNTSGSASLRILQTLQVATPGSEAGRIQIFGLYNGAARNWMQYDGDTDKSSYRSEQYDFNNGILTNKTLIRNISIENANNTIHYTQQNIAYNSVSAQTIYSQISSRIITNTSTAEYGDYSISIMRNGALATYFDINASTDLINAYADLTVGGNIVASATAVDTFLQLETSASTIGVQLSSVGVSYLKGGNFGVGTDVPDELLHSAKSVDGDAILLLLENSQANSAASTNERSQIRFGFGGDNDVARIVVGKEQDYTSAANSDSFMAFYTDLNGTVTEKMRIKSNGYVGIGISPATMFHVREDSAIAGGGIARFENQDPIGAIDLQLITNSSTSSYGFVAAAGSPLTLRSNPTGSAVSIVDFDATYIKLYKNTLLNINAPGAGAVGVLAIGNGTQGSALANAIQIVSEDISAGNTTLSLQTEGTAIIGTGTPTADRTVHLKINGTDYYLIASTLAA